MQHRVDDRHVLVLLLVVDESLADVANGYVGMQFCLHNFFGYFVSLPNE